MAFFFFLRRAFASLTQKPLIEPLRPFKWARKSTGLDMGGCGGRHLPTQSTRGRPVRRDGKASRGKRPAVVLGLRAAQLGPEARARLRRGAGGGVPGGVAVGLGGGFEGIKGAEARAGKQGRRTRARARVVRSWSLYSLRVTFFLLVYRLLSYLFFARALSSCRITHIYGRLVSENAALSPLRAVTGRVGAILASFDVIPLRLVLHAGFGGARFSWVAARRCSPPRPVSAAFVSAH